MNDNINTPADSNSNGETWIAMSVVAKQQAEQQAKIEELLKELDLATTRIAEQAVELERKTREYNWVQQRLEQQSARLKTAKDAIIQLIEDGTIDDDSVIGELNDELDLGLTEEVQVNVTASFTFNIELPRGKEFDTDLIELSAYYDYQDIDIYDTHIDVDM